MNLQRENDGMARSMTEQRQPRCQSIANSEFYVPFSTAAATCPTEHVVGLRNMATEMAALFKLQALGRAFFCIFVAPLFFGCTPAPNLIGVSDLGAASATEKLANVHRIFVVTSRRPSADTGVFFSGERSDTVHFARVDVSLPPSHIPGNIEFPRRSVPDPQQHFVLGNPKRIETSGGFLQQIDAAVSEKPHGAHSALVFVHGYNTNMTEAVARLAQVVEDTGYEGVPVLFSWPSTSETVDYVADINSAAASRDALASTMTLLDQSRLRKYDLVAHSMGNFLTMEAARTLSLEGKFNRTSRMKTVVLAAPDIDVDLFRNQIERLPGEARSKFVVLISRDDKALRISQKIAGDHARVGAADAGTLGDLGMTVIDLTDIEDKSSINHSKFATSPEIVQLIGKRLAAGDNLSTDQSTAGVVIQKLGNVVEVVGLN